MELNLIEIKRDQEFLVLEQITRDFNGIILVFLRDKLIGYINYSYDGEEWRFHNSIDDSCYDYDNYDLIDTIEEISKNRKCDISFKAIKFE